MLNPWISLSFQAARLGWQAQDAMVAGFFRMARGTASDFSEPSVVSDEEIAAKGASDVGTTVPAEPVASRAVAQKVVQIQRKARRGNKRRHTK
jgi:hypothetical protein